MGRIAEELAKAKKSKASDNGKSKKRNADPVNFRAPASIDSGGIEFASLPNVPLDDEVLVENRIVAAQPEAPERSVYKVLRTRVLQRLRASAWNVLGVSGTGPGEGKTLTAINLAFSLAQDVSHRVILIDLDLRRPSIHSYLGVEPKHDLSDYLNGSLELKDILVRPGEDRLAIMTNQTAFRDSSEVLSSPEMGALIHQLRNLGPKTITVLDLPPVLAGDDVLAISPLIDAMLLVVAQGMCKREHLAEAHELVKEANILGVILNRSRDRSSSQGYYDSYQY